MKKKILIDLCIAVFAIIFIINATTIARAGAEQTNDDYNSQNLIAVNEGDINENKDDKSFNSNSNSLGDVNNDGVVNASDASLVLIRISYLEAYKELPTELDLRLGDSDGDEKLSAIDASLILDYAARIGAGTITDDFETYMNNIKAN